MSKTKKLPPFRESLKAARLRVGMTQAELEDRLNPPTFLNVSEFETKDMDVDLFMIVRFARALDITCDELVGRTEPGVTYQPPSQFGKREV